MLGRIRKTLIEGARRGTGRALGLLFHSTPIAPGDVQLPEAPRILVTRLNWRMGNLLLLTPALAAIRAHRPAARIHVLCGDRYADLLRGSPDVDVVWPLPRRGSTLSTTLATLRGLRAAQLDLAIDAGEGRSTSNAFLVGVSKARYRVGFAGKTFSHYFNVQTPPPPKRLHRIHAIQQLLSAIGIPPAGDRMRIYLDETETAWAERRWHETGLAGREVVGLNVGARGGKRWPIERFVALARALDARGRGVILFVGPEEHALLESDAALPPAAVLDRTHEPRRFAALLQRCAIVVTGDTGPMHLALAAGARVLALFLDEPGIARERSGEYGPLGERHRVLYRPDGPGIDEVLAAIEEPERAPLSPRA